MFPFQMMNKKNTKKGVAELKQGSVLEIKTEHHTVAGYYDIWKENTIVLRAKEVKHITSLNLAILHWFSQK